MTGKTPPRDADIEQVNHGLSEGLKSCRSVVANYKALLSADPGDDPPAELISKGAAQTKPGEAPEASAP